MPSTINSPTANLSHLKYTGFYLLCSYFLITLLACHTTPETHVDGLTQSKTPAEDSIVIQAKDYKLTNISDLNSQKTLAIKEGNNWFQYELDVPQAGRYKLSIDGQSLSDTTKIWLEDYVDNKDDRTYNISGFIDLNKNNHTIVGIPLNEGKHLIKMHATGPASVKSFNFKLIKKHQASPTHLTQNTKGDKLKLVWADEFNDTIIDDSKWTYDIGNWGWGNNELQFYTEKEEKNARIENGNLIIQAHQNHLQQPWTSARLTTRAKVGFTYGRIEIRAKVPAVRGTWAAGWTLGDDYVDELSWPYCGEIDILESVGYETDDPTGKGIAHASTHTRAYYFKLGNHHTGTLDVDNISTAFNIYGIEWTQDSITAFVNDEVYFSYSEKEPATAWPFDEPQNIILNLAIGGGWGGAKGIDPKIDAPKMLVDYVRVYEWTDH